MDNLQKGMKLVATDGTAEGVFKDVNSRRGKNRNGDGQDDG